MQKIEVVEGELLMLGMIWMTFPIGLSLRHLGRQETAREAAEERVMWLSGFGNHGQLEKDQEGEEGRCWEGLVAERSA